MEYDKTYSIYFWVDYIVTPQWQKRSHAENGCYSCAKRIGKSSPHCHLCGLLFCRDCVTYRHLPERFNQKKRPTPCPLSVCVGCVEQVQTRRLAVLSELSRLEDKPLSDYIDLPVMLPLDDSSSSSKQKHTMAHIFIGIRNNFTIRQLYNILVHNRTIPHMYNVIFTHQGGMVTVSNLDSINASGLLPIAYLATKLDLTKATTDNPTPLSKPPRQRQTTTTRSSNITFPTPPPPEDNSSSSIPLPPPPGASNSSMGGEAPPPPPPSPSLNSTSHTAPPPPPPADDADNTIAAQSSESISVDSKPKKKKKGVWVVAIHSYLNTKPGKILSFAKGDRLRVINKKSDEWWFAVTEHGETKGWIPAQYVQEESVAS